ncbi:FGGY-family carbohydrate kinase [Pseudonocardia sp. CA-107938]|uniref:FGGY-family carbohydrate kinase n=1 Tax=Pseudonocardia sp. CA-107938 TaxID=3240021 RepID=UPI003D935102
MPDRIWIGVDLGTQSVRAIAVDSSGVQLAMATRPLVSVRDGRRHEQDPASWWARAVEVLAETTAALPAGARIGGIAVCGTSGTVALTGPDGTPRTPGLMYDDTRAGDLAARVQEAGAALWERLGYRMQPAWALPKLLWWREQGLLRDGARLVHQTDLVTAGLAGRPVAADSSHALKTGYDLLDRRWPVDVLQELGIDPGVLPEVVAAGAVLGEVGAAAADSTGVPAGTPIVAGMTDGCAAQLAAGALAPGEWNSVLGTTLALKGVTRHLLRDATGAVYSHRAPHGDLWLPGGASSTGAGALTELFPGADLDALTDAARRLRSVPLCYPLTGHGERFPFVAPEARGFWIDGGVERELGPDAGYAAVCLGVAHLERLCFDLLDDAGADVSGRVSFTGGGARNAWWNQLRCDVLGVPVRVPENAEPAVGMAVLAAGTVDGDLLGAAARMVRVRTELHPDPARAAALAPGYDRFLSALTSHGWLDSRIAAHARRRAAA